MKFSHLSLTPRIPPVVAESFSSNESDGGKLQALKDISHESFILICWNCSSRRTFWMKALFHNFNSEFFRDASQKSFLFTTCSFSFWKKSPRKRVFGDSKRAKFTVNRMFCQTSSKHRREGPLIFQKQTGTAFANLGPAKPCNPMCYHTVLGQGRFREFRSRTWNVIMWLLTATLSFPRRTQAQSARCKSEPINKKEMVYKRYA